MNPAHIVAGLEIVLDGEPYMERCFLVGGPRERGPSARFHLILRSDPGRDLHDHPWDFTSVILRGAYTEVTHTGETTYRAGDVIVRRAEDPHRLILDDGPVWTLVRTGPVRRRWGFHTPAGWVHWSDYAQAGEKTG